MPEYSLWLCRGFPRCPPAFPDGFHRKQSAVSLSACADPPDKKSGTMLPEASAQGNFLIVGKAGAEGGIRNTPVVSNDVSCPFSDWLELWKTLKTRQSRTRNTHGRGG